MAEYSPEKLREILRFSAIHHKGQEYSLAEDKKKIEYFFHITIVLNELFGLMNNAKEEIDWDLALACAALHDTIEDTEVTEENLREKYGAHIAAGVAALTKNESLPSEESMADSLMRIKKQPKEIWCVKLADRIVNLSAPPYYWDMERKSYYVKESKVILEELGAASTYLASRLEEAIKKYQSNYC